MAHAKKLEKRVGDAIRHFWTTRSQQDRRQGERSGQRDYGNRTAATGGKQLDGFVELLCQLLRESGVGDDAVFRHGREDVTLPGFFRPTKQWDVLVIAGGMLLASIECKALCGPSFGNNFNNRIEEALGTSTDLWTAYREGIFDTSPRPFLGYVLLVEDTAASNRPVKVHQKHFPVRQPFINASYADRCEESLRRMVRERCYDATSLLLSDSDGGVRGKYREPADDLAFARFATLMCNHVSATYNSL